MDSLKSFIFFLNSSYQYHWVTPEKMKKTTFWRYISYKHMVIFHLVILVFGELKSQQFIVQSWLHPVKSHLGPQIVVAEALSTTGATKDIEPGAVQVRRMPCQVHRWISASWELEKPSLCKEFGEAARKPTCPKQCLPWGFVLAGPRHFCTKNHPNILRIGSTSKLLLRSNRPWVTSTSYRSQDPTFLG